MSKKFNVKNTNRRDIEATGDGKLLGLTPEDADRIIAVAKEAGLPSLEEELQLIGSISSTTRRANR